MRYFNAAGASLDSSIGEHHINETHLIPNILASANNHKKIFNLYGDDYDTADGTCIRDYIHVLDLCSANMLTLKAMIDIGESFNFNLGSGTGESVLNIFKKCEEITGKTINYKICKRRFGDPDILIADNSYIEKKIKWQPKYSDIDTIISSAWNWEENKKGIL